MTDLINGISSEVWQVLGAVKTEFSRFGDALDKVGKKLEQAQNDIAQTSVRSRAIQKQLKQVESLPAVDAERILGAMPVSEEDPL